MNRNDNRAFRTSCTADELKFYGNPSNCADLPCKSPLNNRVPREQSRNWRRTSLAALAFLLAFGAFFLAGCGKNTSDLKRFKRGELYGYMGKNDTIALPPQFDAASEFYEGKALVIKFPDSVRQGDLESRISSGKGEFGFIDESGKIIQPLKYEINPYRGMLQGSETTFFNSQGLCVVVFKNKYGFIDKTGKEIVPPKYDSIGEFKEELAAVNLAGKWGFIDKTGEEVVSCKYDDIQPFSEGRTWVMIGEIVAPKYGIIDKTGKEIVPCKYKIVMPPSPFKDGVAGVVAVADNVVDGSRTIKYFYINREGTEFSTEEEARKSIAPAK
jgi:hypothetical protein